MTDEAMDEVDDSFWCGECGEYVTTQCRGDEHACVFNWPWIRDALKETK